MTSNEFVYSAHYRQRRQDDEHDKNLTALQKETLEKNDSIDENKLFQKDGLPPLEGSPNQIAWANTIRLTFIKQTKEDIKAAKTYMNQISHHQGEYIETINIALSNLLQTKTCSRYWIDNRIEKNYVMLKEFM